MTTNDPGASSVLDAVQEILPEIADRSADFERDRRVGTDVLDRLLKAGTFRMLLPERLGGEGLNLLQTSRVLEAIARADASTAWTVMVGADFPVFMSHFSSETCEEFYGSAGADTLARGAFAPKGIAVPADGGYTVSGQWPLASGSYEYDWVFGGCIVMENGAPRMLEGGMPDLRIVITAPENANFLDTWDSVGLRATMSTDFVLQEVFVPEAFTAPFFGESTWPEPLYHLPPFPTGPTHMAVAIGIAQGALDDLGTLSQTKRPAFNPMVTLNQSPVFHHELGELDLRLSALRAFNEQQAQLMTDRAATGDMTELENLRQRAAGAYVHAECTVIVNEVFALAGSAPLYMSNNIQRRWRDVRCVAQHLAANRDSYDPLGAHLAGAAPAGSGPI
jgi:indole-3-acetate monooxygenase